MFLEVRNLILYCGNSTGYGGCLYTGGGAGGDDGGCGETRHNP